ncbi:MAG: Piwi domain-containing protein [Bryobacteraceae bacterium]|nr:Piwi domain-containing protein [Bryobacteraceae bacterium]
MLANCFEVEELERSRKPSANRVLNFSPVRFDDAEITVGCLPYGDDGEQVLEQLRREHNGTHVFRREGADSILAVPVSPGADLIGKPRTIWLKQHLGLAAALIRNALLTYLAGMGRTVLSYEPMRFIARDDLLRQIDGAAPPDWLSVRLLFEVAIRPVYFFKQEPFIAAVVDVRTTRLIERSVGELIGDGMSLDGFYVGRRVPGDDIRIAPFLKLVGCVKSSDGPRVHLADARDGLESIDASEVWPEKRAFTTCLQHVFGVRAARIGELLESKRAALRHGPTRLDRIKKTVDFLGSKQHEMAPGVPFKFSPLLDSANGLFPQLEAAPRPVFVFNQTGSKTDTWHDRGLTEHGPYTAQVFTPNQPRICVVCQQSLKGQVEQFLHKFDHGINLPPPAPSRDRNRPAKRQTNYFEKGFRRKYALQDIQYEFFLTENNSVESYRKACQRALERHGSGQRWDLAFVQIEEPFHDLPTRSNPYFASKASFQTLQIPVQEFEIETTRRPDKELIYVLNNMGLATYAKLNGIPWLLKANPTIAHELVIGLGSANIGESRLGEHERFVGITTVFSGDGNYHLSNSSKAVPMDEYHTALLETLRASILKVRQDMNWQPRDHVRLVFHATFKRFSDEEVASIKALLSELGDYDVEYAFVQLSEDHPYILFDKGQGGVFDYETKRTKGVYAPERGRYLELGKREVLLSLTGPREVKRPEDGTPHPLFLSLHRDSTFTDMTYLTRQVFTFACHSWRTFLPASVPVTIQYSDLIAKALGHLSLTDRWNPDVMLGRIGKGRWFL